MRIGILGAGYTGAALAHRLAGRDRVVVIGRRAGPVAELAAAVGPNTEPRVATTEDPDALRVALAGLDRVVHLAPPPREGDPAADAARVVAALDPATDRLVYGSTTGVFEVPEDPMTWVDEDWPAGPTGRMGRARLAYEEVLAETAFCPVHIVRIAGIYGPGRTLAQRLREGSLVTSKGGRPTSRIHRDDLARLLEAMVRADAPPPRVVACDELPAPTENVARFTAALLGLPEPEARVEAQADAQRSPMAREFARSGKRCRSLYREALIGPLLYPSYREGVPASLEAG